MSAQRLCRRCREPLGIDDDVCQVCGERNPVTMPWYGPFIGFGLLALIAWLFVDFDPIIDFVRRLLN